MEDKGIALWVYRLTVLLLLLLALGFGWAVQKATTKAAETRSGLERTVLQIVAYPDMVGEALQQVLHYGTGEFVDEAIRVYREPDEDYSDFTPVASVPRIGLEGLLLRADPDRMVRGWRLISGDMMLGGSFSQYVLLMSPDNRITHRWAVREEAISGNEPRPSGRKNLHGLEILSDASIIFNFDGGMSLQRFDKCSRRIWARLGPYHHEMTLDDRAETLWVFNANASMARLAVEDGKTLQSFSAEDLIAANPGIDILELRLRMEGEPARNPRNTKGRWLDDPFHFNDIDPLPAALADRFPGFEPGDLMISARSLNLVFVVDPETLEIKWWRAGAVRRQHDPDWQPDGRITIFDNRMGRDYSQIVALDPVSFEREILFDGRRNDFYTRIRGKHQVLDDGTLVISSPQQGRAFEVAPDGDIVFELVNTKPGSEEFNYTISELRWLPPDFFDVEDWSCPETN